MKILRYPDPRLTAKNEPLGVWTEEAAKKVEVMHHLMAADDGVGLAAPQVGWNVRLFVMMLPDNDLGEMATRVIFDPTLEFEGSIVHLREGCLSFPGMWATIERCDRVRLIGKTPEGKFDQVLIGMSAHAAQHEMDHLNGLLYIDRMTPADRRRNEAVIRALEEGFRP